MSIATYFLGGGGVVVAKILALYAFDRSYTPPSQDKAGFTSPAVSQPSSADCMAALMRDADGFCNIARLRRVEAVLAGHLLGRQLFSRRELSHIFEGHLPPARSG